MIFKISKGAKYGTPASQCNKFQIVEFNTATTLKNDLADLTANYAYSAIEFKNGERKGENFICVFCIILDFDDHMTIEEAQKIFSPFWGYIATTKSHQQTTKGGKPNGKPIEQRDRFRVILFLVEPIHDPKQYVRIITNIINEFGADPACKDLARFYYPNPKQEVYYLDNKGSHFFDIAPYDHEVKSRSVKKVKDKSSKTVSTDKVELLLPDHMITSEDEVVLSAKEWYETVEEGEKIQVHCPFPDHEDKNPSAFIEKKPNGRLFSYCNSCQRKGYYRHDIDTPVSSNGDTGTLEISVFSNAVIQRLHLLKKNEDEKEVSLDRIVSYIIHCGIPIASYAGWIYFWIDGYWQRHSDKEQETKLFIKTALHKVLGKRPNKASVKNLHLELLNEYREYKNPSSVIVNLKSHIFMVNKDHTETIAHSPDYGLRYKLTFDYEPNADSPKIDAFFLQVMGEQEVVNFFFEYLATVFLGTTLKIETALFLYGSGSNGKSVVLDITRELFGSQNISNLPLKEFGNEKSRTVMVGKLLNIASEGSQNKFDTESFKAIISKEPLSIRYLYQDLMETNDFPQCIFATNNLPSTGGDRSHGVMRRIAIIPFEHIIPEEKQDKQLLQKLLPELPGMFNHIIEAIKRIVERGRLLFPDKVKKMNRLYELDNNSVKYFCDLHGYTEDDSVRVVDSKMLYQAYRDLCIQDGIRSLSKKSFSLEMSAIFGSQKHSNKIRGWKIVPTNKDAVESDMYDS